MDDLFKLVGMVVVVGVALFVALLLLLVLFGKGTLTHNGVTWHRGRWPWQWYRELP